MAYAAAGPVLDQQIKETARRGIRQKEPVSNCCGFTHDGALTANPRAHGGPLTHFAHPDGL